MTSLWPNLGAPVDLGRISELTGLPPCDVPTHHSNPSLFAYKIFMAFNMILPHLLAIPAIFDMVEAMKQAGKKEEEQRPPASRMATQWFSSPLGPINLSLQAGTHICLV